MGLFFFQNDHARIHLMQFHSRTRAPMDSEKKKSTQQQRGPSDQFSSNRIAGLKDLWLFFGRQFQGFGESFVAGQSGPLNVSLSTYLGSHLSISRGFGRVLLLFLDTKQALFVSP